MIRCPECKKIVDEKNNSCQYCGYPFNGTEEKVTIKYCAECGAPIEENMEKCPECGKLIDSEILNDSLEDTASQESENEIQNNEAIEDTDSNIEPVELEADSEKKIDIPKKFNFEFNKKNMIYMVGGAVLLVSLIGNCSLYSKYSKCLNNYNDMVSQNKTLNDNLTKQKDENTKLSNQLSELQGENDELKNGASKQLVDIKNAYEQGDWQKVIDLASALHSKYNGTDEDTQAQALATESQAKIDEEKAAQAAKEAQGYETGITYDQLARTPDDYKGEKVKFYGKVVQVIEGDTSTQIRLAVNDDYNTVLFGEFDKSIISSRVLEKDYITVYGKSAGTISYQSTGSGTITIPAVYIEKIDQ